MRHQPKQVVVWIAERTGWFGRGFADVVFWLFPSWRSK